MNKFIIGLAGNPNVGKTTVFNLLTNIYYTDNFVETLYKQRNEGLYNQDELTDQDKETLEEINKQTEEIFREKSSLILIEQQSGSYVLTNEAYEFLFRTKEIDNELDFSVNRFKLKEFIKRGNYSKALRESRELVSRVRNLKTRMDDFMLRCRTNISEVSIDEYEEIYRKICRTYYNVGISALPDGKRKCRAGGI